MKAPHTHVLIIIKNHLFQCFIKFVQPTGARPRVNLHVRYPVSTVLQTFQLRMYVSKYQNYLVTALVPQSKTYKTGRKSVTLYQLV